MYDYEYEEDVLISLQMLKYLYDNSPERFEDAIDMLESIAIPPVISKTRYIVKHDQFVWEIDEFHGSHQGLVIAEVELPTLKTVLDNVPDFVGREVTGDSRYYNSNL